jgi:hypothetical protein
MCCHSIDLTDQCIANSLPGRQPCQASITGRQYEQVFEATRAASAFAGCSISNGIIVVRVA